MRIIEEAAVRPMSGHRDFGSCMCRGDIFGIASQSFMRYCTASVKGLLTVVKVVYVVKVWVPVPVGP